VQSQRKLASAGQNEFRDDAAWTRERWDNAVDEIDQSRRVWHQGNVLNRLSDRTALGDPSGLL